MVDESSWWKIVLVEVAAVGLVQDLTLVHVLAPGEGDLDLLQDLVPALDRVLNLPADHVQGLEVNPEEKKSANQGQEAAQWMMKSDQEAEPPNNITTAITGIEMYHVPPHDHRLQETIGEMTKLLGYKNRTFTQKYFVKK